MRTSIQLYQRKIWHRKETCQSKESRRNLLSERENFGAREVIKDKEHCIIMKGSILPEDSAIQNVNAPNNRNIKTCEAKTIKTARKNGSIQNYSWRFQHPSIKIRQSNQVGNQ